MSINLTKKQNLKINDMNELERYAFKSWYCHKDSEIVDVLARDYPKTFEQILEYLDDLNYE